MKSNNLVTKPFLKKHLAQEFKKFRKDLNGKDLVKFRKKIRDEDLIELRKKIRDEDLVKLRKEIYSDLGDLIDSSIIPLLEKMDKRMSKIETTMDDIKSILNTHEHRLDYHDDKFLNFAS